MQELIGGWATHVERGPEWLYVRLRLEGDESSWIAGDLAEYLWKLMQQQFTCRLVLELDGLACLRSEFIGELVRLHKRVHAEGGLLRLAGLSNENQSVLQLSRLADRFPQYRDRHDAVMGRRPTQPR